MVIPPLSNNSGADGDAAATRSGLSIFDFALHEKSVFGIETFLGFGMGTSDFGDASFSLENMSRC